MEKIMTGLKYDVGCILIGAFTSAFFIEVMEKILMTTISMLIATTIAFFWRIYLHKRFKEILKKYLKKNEDN